VAGWASTQRESAQGAATVSLGPNLRSQTRLGELDIGAAEGPRNEPIEFLVSGDLVEVGTAPEVTERDLNR